MPLKRKIVIVSFLSFGVVVIAIGIARLLWLVDAFHGTSGSYSVATAYSAIESSVAVSHSMSDRKTKLLTYWNHQIIGASGGSLKYILSGCIPWLRASWGRATTNKRSGQSYESGSGAVFSKDNGSAPGTARKYTNLDDDSVKSQDIEMKTDAGWQFDFDTPPDSSQVPIHELGITKSVEWSVQTRKVHDTNAR
jgi:hypothetical protein